MSDSPTKMSFAKTDDTVELKRTCCFCDGSTAIVLDKDKFDRWLYGEWVQNVWPELSADDREMLVTGTHAECWDKLFEEE